MRYAEVAVDAPVLPRLALGADEGPTQDVEPVHAFHYSIPAGLEAVVEVGQWVWVPFGSRQLPGIVVALDTMPPDVQVRPISDIVDTRPVVTAGQLALARWMSEHYLAPLYACLGLFLPPGAAPRTETVYSATGASDTRLTPAQRAVIALLSEHGPLTLSQIEKRLLARAQAQPGPVVGKRAAVAPRRSLESLVRRGLVQRQSRATRGRTGPRYEDAVRPLLAPDESWRALATSIARSAGQRLVLRLAAAQEAGDPLVTMAELRSDGFARRTVRQLEAEGLVLVTPSATVFVPTHGEAAPEPLYRRTLALDELAAYGLPETTVRTMVRQGLLSEHNLPEMVSLAMPAGEAFRALVTAISENLAAALDALLRHPAPLWLRDLMALSGCNRVTVGRLRDAGVAIFERRRFFRDPLIGLDVPPRLPPSLSEDQLAAAAPILAAVRDGTGGAFLIHGVTGSGKTEVYLEAITAALARGQQAIMLVPEIALTAQVLRRFAARFAGRIAVQHSELSDGERYDQWTQIRDGAADIVIGSRSALFAPLPRLGLIVLDEEHEPSYKQERQPHYHARDAALELARATGAVVVLGSATPDVCSYRGALRGRLTLLGLGRRFGNGAAGDMPTVRVVDMRRELREGHAGLCSRPLIASLAETLARRQQAILYLNRRGSATFVMCRDCGHVVECPRCNLPLTYHASPANPEDTYLSCHHCGLRRPQPRTCPECSSTRIRYFGAGTERLQAYAQSLFPRARIVRWDRDTTRLRGGHDAILQSFLRHDADILVGTQMVAKGLDLPLVTLVGVVAADTALFVPDFRGAERAFQLLAQVVGRSGRSDLGGSAIVQTYHPEHYAVRAAAEHNYSAFYEREIAHRYDLGYPPFGQMTRLVYSHRDNRRCREESERLANRLRLRIRQIGAPNLDVVGPTPCFYSRLRGEYRWHIILRGEGGPALLRRQPLAPGWRVDVDPMTFL